MSGIYPYLYTRGAFMKKRLLRQSDYHKLLKMDLPEIIKYLEESDYKKAIDELALELKGIDLIEAALNRSLGEFFRKIRQMADMKSKAILDVYLRRWDIHNAKTAMRTVFSNVPVEKMGHLLVVAGAYPKEFFIELAKQGSVEEIIKRLSFVDEKTREALALAYGSSKALLQVESMLDQMYYHRMFRHGKRLGAEAALFKRFLADEVAIINLKTVLRLRAEHVEPAEIRKYLIMQEGKQDAELMAVLNAPSESIIPEAQKTRFGVFLGGAATGVDVEIAAERHLVETYASSAYMNPMSITPLLTIMFIKAAEVANLKGLVKAKQLGMAQEFIEQKVVVQW